MIIAAGQEFSETIIERIRRRVSGDEGISRTKLSQEVCEWLDWRHKDGRVKEMNCRVALKGLEQAGVIELPAARAGAFFRRREPAAEPVEEWPVVSQSLKELGPVWLEEIKPGDKELSQKWWALMEQHPLKGGPLCGAQIRYLIGSRAGYLGGLSFSAAAFRLAARDRWIGWNEEQRKAGRERVVANSRFLLLPTVEVAHLASHVLGIARRRLADDWEARYGTRPALVETFVDPKEQSGTCYRAANWLFLGETSGRGRQGQRSGREAAQSKKQIWVYPLTKASRAELNGGKAEPAPTPQWPVKERVGADWAELEFSRCELGDARLHQRVTVLARDFYARPNANLPQACGNRAKTKAAYRFFDLEATTMKNLLAGHYAAAAERMSPEKVVLAVQDTTSLNYTTHREMKGLGPIHTSATGAQGLLLHSTHAFAVDGRALGYLDVQSWARDPEPLGKKAARRNLPIEEKESVIWLRSYRAVAELQPQMPATLLVSVGDREADIYELFRLAEETPDGPKLLVRSKSDRCLEEEQGRLKATMAALPVAGTYPLRVPRKGNQKARDTVMEIRFAPVTLKAPRRQLQADKTAPSLPVWAVLAQEVNPPEGITPLKWLLLTTVAVNSYQAAEEKVRWYQMRWSIEDLHRTIKSGCRIEQRQLGQADRLEACLAIDLVVAWRIYALKRLARQDPDAPCTVYFQDHEWKALVVFITRVPVPPEHPPSLRDATRMVAQLGGFLGRKGDGEPGTQTLWLGLQRLDDIANIFQFLRESMAATQPSVSSNTYG